MELSVDAKKSDRKGSSGRSSLVPRSLSDAAKASTQDSAATEPWRGRRKKTKKKGS
jgi:hypothetical protein